MKLNIGDVVRLKTGGPQMTVENVGPFMRALHDTKPAGLDSALALELRTEEAKHDSRTAWCVWFVKIDGSDSASTSPYARWTGPCRDRFDVNTLEVVSGNRNRCLTCESFAENLELFRDPSAEEVERYPYVKLHRPRVARAHCKTCNTDCLAIEWSVSNFCATPGVPPRQGEG